MTRFDDALEAFTQARQEERDWHPSKGPLRLIMLRRDAALREVHAAENPWQACVCPLCSGRG